MTLGSRAAVVIAFGVVWLVWGSTYLAIAWAVETVPPLMMIGARCLVAGAALYGWGRLRGGPRPRAADWRAAALAGLLLFVTGQAVLAWAETRIPSGVASLLIATEPIFVALLAWRAGAGAGPNAAAPSPSTVAAIVTGLVGVGWLMLPGSTAERVDPLAAGAVVVAALSWSVGIFRARARPGVGSAQTAGMQLLAAGPILLALSIGMGEPDMLPETGPSARSLVALAYLVVFGSIVAFGAYVWLLGRVSAQRVSTHAYVNPLVAVALGAALNGEPVTVELIAAGTLIVGSVAMLLRARPAGRDASRVHAGDAVSAPLRRPVSSARARRPRPWPPPRRC